MLKHTAEAVKAICQTDPTISALQVKAALAELEGNGTSEMKSELAPRSYKPKQVATLLGCSLRAVENYRKRGLLKPIYTGAQGLRVQSYTGDSVSALLSGNAVKDGEVA